MSRNNGGNEGENNGDNDEPYQFTNEKQDGLTQIVEMPTMENRDTHILD